MRSTLNSFRAAMIAALLIIVAPVMADPLPPASIPDQLRSWIPWALHGNKAVGCPQQATGGGERQCVWPSALALTIANERGQFKQEVQVFGGKTFVQIPGAAEQWPQDVKSSSTALPVVERDGKPYVELGAGQHTLTGDFIWPQKPRELLLPVNVGVVSVRVDGSDTRLAPDKSGRLVLREQQDASEGQDGDSIRVSRLLDDEIPLRLTTRFEIALGGKPRELALDGSLLDGFSPESVVSDLPARLTGGKVLVQARPGNWVVEVRGRSTQPLKSIGLPAALAREEVWAFAARNNLRMVNIEGVTALDPKQVPVLDAWQRFPLYRVRAGDTPTLVEKYRGNANPAPDKLSVAREFWLDFSGEAFTTRDTISGTLSRAWRLDVQHDMSLGRVSSGGSDQPVTRVGTNGAPGFEIRDTSASVVADSRVPFYERISASGWDVDVNSLSATLHMPPGWMLLHANGPDRAEGSWVSRWTLWDFFFVLITAFAAARLFGRPAGALMLAGLVLSWHAPGAPHFVWLAILFFHALHGVLPDGVPRRLARTGKWLALGGVAFLLIPFAVEQVRLAMHPNLEMPWQTLGNNAMGQIEAARAANKPAWAAAPAPAPAAAPIPEQVADEGRLEPADRAGAGKKLLPQSDAYSSLRANPYNGAPARAKALARRFDEIDPSARIQTGPGVPTWEWNSYRLVWSGPVAKDQTIAFVMLSPLAHAAMRMASLTLLVCMLLALAGRLTLRLPGRDAGAALAALVLGMTLVGQAPDTAAATLAPPVKPGRSTTQPAPQPAVEAASEADGNFFAPSQALLDQMVQKLTAPADCQPNCAAIARAVVSGAGPRLVLGLEVHAQAEVFLPIPASEQDWQVRSVLADGKTAATRRDNAGNLLVALSRGVHQVIVEADVGSAAAVNLVLPMPVRLVRNEARGWTLTGLDARGITSNALSLRREVAVKSGEDRLSSRDSFPAFVRIQRTLHLGLQWKIETQISRISQSQAPIMARVKLLPGESVLDPVVKVGDGEGTVQLGENGSVSFVSVLKEQADLKLVSSKFDNQIEVWQLDVSPLWNVALAGIAPILNQGAPSAPVWMPWPGEEVSMRIERPAGVDGETITADRTSLVVSPGQRETNVISETVLRTSQAANHRFVLPESAKLMALTVDGQVQIVQPQGNGVTASIGPGPHLIKLEWREPRGMETFFDAQHLAASVAGGNNFTTVVVPHDRVVLAVGGDGYGPAVLFWGVAAVLLLVAWGLARTRLVPLGFVAWTLLGIGLAQSTVAGAFIVVGLFFALYARKRFVDLLGGWRLNAAQVLLMIWALVAIAILMSAIQTGLLGFPSLLIEGNGSSAFTLNWYLDRASAGQAPHAWVVSAPLWLYRAVMLLWALWLAASMLRWIKWGWSCFVEGGYWRKIARKKPRTAARDAAGNATLPE